MIRLLFLFALATAGATPPPRPTEGPARMEGFHRIFVTPDAFADGLVPIGGAPLVPPPPPPPTPPPSPPSESGEVVLFFVLEPQAATAAGHTATTLAEHLDTIEGITSVEVSPDGAALKLVVPAGRDLTTLAIPTNHEQPVPLGSLGVLQPLPDIRPRMPGAAPGAPPGGVPRPQAVPKPEPGWDLVLQNPASVRLIVKVGDVEVGQLQPLGQAVIHGVREGTYAVAFVGPTGFVRSAEVRAVPAATTASRPAE